jgi:N-acetylmuramic acid 6-phosphate etherase
LKSFLGSSPTEARNPRSMNLDELETQRAVELMFEEEAGTALAVKEHSKAIAALVEQVAKAFRRGGHLFYVGAGTSGRLGILDASECPPTFGVPHALVQGIIAGGRDAVFRAVEGAEDDFSAGEEVIGFRKIGRKDVVVGIAASGRTPFVWGALTAARKAGAHTALLCFNPNLKITHSPEPHQVIAINVGPEVLTGSTRLKSGTATKLVLNAITTLSMVRIGKVISNLMVDVQPTNEKLRQRAVGIVQQITGCAEESAREALVRNGWVVGQTIRALQKHKNAPPNPK